MPDTTDYSNYPPAGKNPDGSDFVNPHPTKEGQESIIGYTKGKWGAEGQQFLSESPGRVTLSIGPDLSGSDEIYKKAKPYSKNRRNY